ncbi:MAG: 4Fe-4S dicluster domain-containing protein [Planctomycetes bacterium]|nr:4Fe-4S dicluster domain-containing protein [Planctomycetota bacterium]
MVIDLDKCTGCRGCAAACRAENNIATAGPERAEEGRGIYWMDLLTVEEGEYPNLRSQFIPTPCNHCENAPCVKVCPVGATYINEEGIVAQIWARCIGCRYCTTACPYTRRYFNWQAPSWPEEDRQRLNPDVATRPKGVVEKCTFCHHRIRAARESARAEGRLLSDADVRKLPACAQSCPAEAIVFGDLNDPESEVSRLAASPRAFRLQEELGTHPKVVYLREAKWRE